MTRDLMKQKMRSLNKTIPAAEYDLETSIDEAVQFVWDAFPWSWKQDTGTFTSSTGTETYELNSDVDTILEITYGTNKRKVEPLPDYRISEIYSNQSRSGSEVYYFSFVSATSDAITIRLTPTPDGADTFYYDYIKKIDYGDLSAIPEKLHSLVLLGANMFLSTGDLYGSPTLQNAVDRAILNDKPIRHKGTTFRLDGLIASRINDRNALRTGGGTDTTKPYN